MITTPDGYCGDGFIADVDTLANAALISAAPDLYASVKELLGLVPQNFPMNHTMDCAACGGPDTDWYYICDTCNENNCKEK
jgi:hypothetical protein